MISRRKLLATGPALLMAAALPAGATTRRIVALGDSLTAGYRLRHDLGFPARLEAALKAAGHDVRVSDAGVSGDTSAGGLARLAWSVPDGTDLVILELGGNDGLRGLDPARIKANLGKIISKLKARRIGVLLAGIKALPNMGQQYGSAFSAIYPALAREYQVPLYPFFLEGVYADRKLNLDGIHPNARGIAIIVERILPYVISALSNLPKE